MTGKLLCCFDTVRNRSGKDRLAIRVLKILEHVRFTDPTYQGKLPMIEEGQLLRAPATRQIMMLGGSSSQFPPAAFHALINQASNTRQEDI
jgi:hypothetical protein